MRENRTFIKDVAKQGEKEKGTGIQKTVYLHVLKAIFNMNKLWDLGT